MDLSSREQSLQQFLDWARSRADILAVALLGSSARSDHPADEWSDLDLLIIATDPPALFVKTGWVEVLGKPWITLVEKGPDGAPLELRVLLENGQDVDFIILPLESARQNFMGTFVAEVAQRGRRVLLDREGTLTAWAEQPLLAAVAQPPTPLEFSAVVNDFWFHAIWTAKKLKRSELWVVKSCCDGYMKQLLLSMMEWHARATQAGKIDTWYNGRYLVEWLPPEVRHDLLHVFAHYDEEDVWRALTASLDLFDRLARETAGRLSYPYEQEQAGRVKAWIAEHR